MTTATRIAPRRRLFGSNIAMAIALASVGTLGVTALEAPAYAKKKKDDKAKKIKLSKDFEKAYNAMIPLYNAEEPDAAAVRAAIPGMLAEAKTGEDQQTAGNLLSSFGTKLDDDQMRLQGINLMLNSGLEGEREGLLNYAKFQIQDGAGDIDGARNSLIAAANAGYTFDARLSDGTTRTMTSGDVRVMASQIYFDNDRYAEGLADLRGWLQSQIDQGQTIDERWVRRGFATALNNDMAQEATAFSVMYLQTHPSESVWSDSVVVQTNLYDYGSQETLDLMRLARRTGVLSGDRLKNGSLDETRQMQVKQTIQRFYLDYGEAADYRRLPGEVNAILDEGIAAGHLDPKGITIADWKSGASSRIRSDRAELPGLEAEARGSSSSTLVMSTGDAFLSYDQFAKAEEFYTKALGMPGVDTPRALMRLGIAQADQGKHAQAKENFAKITGVREPIARLWMAYVDQKSVTSPVIAVPASEVVAAAAAEAS